MHIPFLEGSRCSCHSLILASDSLLFALSPGEVPDTREALLSAFKRLDNDISLEAQVGPSADSVERSVDAAFKASRADLDLQCFVCLLNLP